jgi:hypothetical protein
LKARKRSYRNVGPGKWYKIKIYIVMINGWGRGRRRRERTQQMKRSDFGFQAKYDAIFKHFMLYAAAIQISWLNCKKYSSQK